MKMKKNVTIRVEEKVVKEAQEVGLNVSRVCENALKEAIKRLKSDNCPAPSERPTSQDHESQVAPGKGFEPLRPKGPHALKACALPGLATPAPNNPLPKVITTFR
jgi:hypothetical protein